MCTLPEGTGLTELVTVVWCVLLLGPYGMSAPTGKMLWVDPCGGHPIDGSGGERRSDSDLLDIIRVTAERARNRAKDMASSFTVDLFPGHSIIDVNKLFPNRKEWLISPREVPKKYGEPTPDSHYYSWVFKSALVDNLIRYYRHLQTLAVALEQVVHDMKHNGEKYANDFECLLHQLKQVLCEVLMAIGELKPDHEIVDITRAAMPEEERKIEESYRSARDWVIFREYIMYMEYIIQSCEMIKAFYNSQ